MAREIQELAALRAALQVSQFRLVLLKATWAALPENVVVSGLADLLECTPECGRWCIGERNGAEIIGDPDWRYIPRDLGPLKRTPERQVEDGGSSTGLVPHGVEHEVSEAVRDHSTGAMLEGLGHMGMISQYDVCSSVNERSCIPVRIGGGEAHVGDPPASGVTDV